ncbi:MAG: hypothetical protein R3C53_22290 [Pirellulaceae bacterium]
METAESWRALFDNWPTHLERRGSVLSKQGESLWFDNFLVAGNIVLLERAAPDAFGARKVFIGYDSIALVKLPSTVELKEFQSMGFRPPRGDKPAAPKSAS